MNVKEFINLTPHAIIMAYQMQNDNGEFEDAIVNFPPSGIIARVKTNNVQIGTLDVQLAEYTTYEDAQFAFPLHHVVYEDVENLPPPQDGIMYIVSAIVATACKDRTDVVAPDTGATAVRDKDKNIAAVRGFLKY